jgi:filamentous hemagglutinin
MPSIKQRLRQARLPCKGKIRFVPPKGYKSIVPLRRGPNGGYIDRFDNEWIRPRGYIVGERHWDVQLSSIGRQQLGWASRTGGYINVSEDGRIVH